MRMFWTFVGVVAVLFVAGPPLLAQRPVTPQGQVEEVLPPGIAKKLERKLVSADAVRVELLVSMRTGDNVDDIDGAVFALVYSGDTAIETVPVDKAWLMEFLSREGSPVTPAQMAGLMIALRDEAEAKLLGDEPIADLYFDDGGTFVQRGGYLMPVGEKAEALRFEFTDGRVEYVPLVKEGGR